MKLKHLGPAALAALALMAFATTASATTIEINGVKQTGVTGTEWSLKANASGSVKDTGGFFANTCTSSTIKGSDSSAQTGTTTSGPVSTLTFSKCTEEPVVVDSAGTTSIEWISGTTNGTARSNGAKVTTPSPFGALTCTTSNTDLGTITGVASGQATMDVNAVLNCGFFLPSAKLEATYVSSSAFAVVS